MGVVVYVLNHALVCEEVSNRNRRGVAVGVVGGWGQVSDNVISKACILWLARTV